MIFLYIWCEDSYPPASKISELHDNSFELKIRASGQWKHDFQMDIDYIDGKTPQGRGPPSRASPSRSLSTRQGFQ